MVDWNKIDKRWEDEQYCLEAVKQNGHSLRYVKEQTPEIVYFALENSRDIDIDIIKITKDQWLEFKLERPELFV